MGTLTEQVKEKKKGEGARHNAGKVRFDLLPANAMLQTARVFSMGAEKYGDRNWELGMDWSKVTASLERHLQAFKRGEDYDKESGELHMAHVVANALFLLEYYKIYPQGDDRPHSYLAPPKIALDIDGVLADFCAAYDAKFGKGEHGYAADTTVWDFDYSLGEKMRQVKDDEEFWLTMPRLVNPSDLKFEPVAYVSARSIPEDFTRKWLVANGFPAVPVYHTKDKAETLKSLGVDIFVDDSFQQFQAMNRAGICTYLMDAPYNRRYDVGFKRLISLIDL